MTPILHQDIWRLWLLALSTAYKLLLLIIKDVFQLGFELMGFPALADWILPFRQEDYTEGEGFSFIRLQTKF
jgi:hypothetical protein